MDGLYGFFEFFRIFLSLARGSHRSVFVGFDPIIESEVPEKRPLGPAPNGRKVILIVPKL